MSKIAITGAATGTATFTIESPATSTNRTLTIPDEAGTITTSNSPYSTFRNRIINGDMRIDQRNAGASVSAGSAVTAYCLDRFLFSNSTDGAITVQQDTSVPTGFVNSLKIAISTADASLSATQNLSLIQRIEGTNIADLGWGTANAQTVTLSFRVRSSLTGTFGGSLRNSAANRSYPFTYSILVADTFEYKTVEIEGDTSGTWITNNGLGIQLCFGLGAGIDRSGTADAWNANNNTSATGAVSVIGTLNATWFVTGVQLEVGSVATPFERRPFGTELGLCQRYAYVNRVLLGTFGAFGLTGFFENTTTALILIRHPVEMRASPTYVFSAANTFITQGTSNITPSAIALGNASTFGGVINATVSGATAGAGCHLIRNNSNGTETTITASAEL